VLVVDFDCQAMREYVQQVRYDDKHYFHFNQHINVDIDLVHVDIIYYHYDHVHVDLYE
jgi:hypothetical protein